MVLLISQLVVGRAFRDGEAIMPCFSTSHGAQLCLVVCSTRFSSAQFLMSPGMPNRSHCPERFLGILSTFSIVLFHSFSLGQLVSNRQRSVSSHTCSLLGTIFPPSHTGSLLGIINKHLFHNQ